MSSKRSMSQMSPNKRTKTETLASKLVQRTLQESGLTWKHPPDKCILSNETINVIRNLKKQLQNHFEYPRNVSELCKEIENDCKDMNLFKHYLFPNIVKVMGDNQDELALNDSLMKILLSVPLLQNKLTDIIFEKAIDLAADSKCGPWIQMILRNFSSIDYIINSEKVGTHLINLLDVSSERLVKLEIITSLPDIIGDQEHNNIANELSRILSEDHDLIPAILDCLSYLCLTEDQYALLQTRTLNLLSSLTKCNYYPNFIKFLLMPAYVNDTLTLESIQGLRNALVWSTITAKSQDIASSQVLTASSIRTSMISSKNISNIWLKVISSVKTSSEYKPIDFVIYIILFSTSEEKQKQVDNLIRKQIKSDILKEELIDESFEKFKPIYKDYIKHLIALGNSLLKTRNDPLLVSFASHIYIVMLSELDDCCQIIVAELLQLCLDSKQYVMPILNILNSVALKDISLLKSQSLQMLSLLDRMDEMTIHEIKGVMNLVCGLAYSFENSLIRDDMHMIIRKELSSSNPKVKIQGILAGIHAIKYLMVAASEDDHTVEVPDDVSYGTITHLSSGDLREAAQIIELISRSTRQFSDMIAFFYDELCQVVSPTQNINKNFLSWLTDAVTNDLQQNFIVDSIAEDKIDNITLSMQFCINTESEMDEIIAINIAGLMLRPHDEVSINILPPLFQLVQTLHYKQQDGDLSSIDALLGCAVVMPKFDIDLLEDMDTANVTKILDCLTHCINWFRELLNAFSTQTDAALKTKILNRLLQLEHLELLVSQIMSKTQILYRPPSCVFNINKYTGQNVDKKIVKAVKPKVNKKNDEDDTVIIDTGKTQSNKNNLPSNKNDVQGKHYLRPLNFNVIHLLKTDLVTGNSEWELTPKTLKYLLHFVNNNMAKIFVSKIKKNTFLTKSEDSGLYDKEKAEECAKVIDGIIPKIMDHIKVLTSYLDEKLTDNSQNNSQIDSFDIIHYVSCLESLYDFFTIYFKWIGFRKGHSGLLKSSLRTIASVDSTNVIITMKELTIDVVKYFQNHEKYCTQLSVAVALINLIKAVTANYPENKIFLKILTDMAKNFLSKQWKSLEGTVEKGLIFNQNIDNLFSTYFVSCEIVALKNLTTDITYEIQLLKSRNDTLSKFKCINKSNFPVLFRSLGTALYETTKAHINKGLTNSEHLVLWKDVSVILKQMSDITKSLDSRNNLSAFFKKSLPILKLFLSQGIPILELQFKNETQEVLEILKILQQTTRFLQSLCCHSRLKNDSVLMSKVPYMRQLLETLIYKVKAVLAANKCSEAFWMGNLKNKDIHGEIIATQHSVESEGSNEDCDDQLPEDDNSEDSDEEMINPDSRSVSDIV